MSGRLDPLWRLTLHVLAVVAVGLAVTRVAMRPPPDELLAIARLYGLAGLLTVALHPVATRLLPRARSFRTAVQLVAVTSLVVVAAGVVGAAETMFLGAHDRDLVLLVLALGLALGTSLAVAVGATMQQDLRRLAAAAEAVAGGDLSARSGVARADELGGVAATFDRMVARLAANEEERTLLLASVGHDLRTPLASLRALLEGAQDGVVALDEPTVAAMGRDVERLGQLVEDLFLHARTAAGRYEPRPEPVDLAELCDEAAEALGPVARRRGVAVRATTTHAVPVHVDPAALGRVLRNLLDNAVRHAPAGSSVEVAVTSAPDPGFVVRDDGPGFPPELVEEAPVPFRRGDPARRPAHGGAGLGLAIAHAMVQAHGGTLELRPGPGGYVAVHGLPTAAAQPGVARTSTSSSGLRPSTGTSASTAGQPTGSTT